MDPDPSSFITLLSLGFYEISGVVLLFVLLIASALISGSEVALFSLTPTDFNTDSNKYTPKEQLLIRLLDKPKKLLATILVANNFVNIAVILLFDSLGKHFFGSLNTVFFGVNLRFLVEVVVVTFLILLFGEILPKVYASRNNVKFAYFMAYPLAALDKLFAMVSLPMSYVTAQIHARLGKQKSHIGVDQLSQALALTSQEDTTQEEQKILQGIISFGNTETRQVMQPRMDVFALEINQSYTEVLTEIVENGYSRIPVYEDNLDNIKGILYIKDVLPHLTEANLNWQNLIREPYFVPENKKLDDLLNDFKTKKNHLAIVVDEYGGTSGLISLEDIIEEIVGDISDEFDDEDIIFSKLDENNFIFEGKTTLKDFYKIIKLSNNSVFEEHKGEAETLAGFILEISGKFPKRNEKISFRNYTFTIEVIDNRRVKQLKVSRTPISETSEA
ncbi:gliding motility-associated protein GldE [Mesonia hippocampi]|uniref:Gliding motility-associated protein GldE n=1 Tax=Mesonia hippocampi TaxID=1628250 RepID=A0A840EWV7_9FLAO|nr:gliding motility-associated protein GldE [Mesonia hippocampi]MBB4119307.1 gliding motility-associated protein GldE [Mesonia hippocampi]